MSAAHYLRKAVSMPPQVFARKAAGRLRDEIRRRADSRRDALLPTYPRVSASAAAPLHRYFRILPAASLSPLAPQLRALAAHYCEHRFDLLGSGWTRVAHGVACRGVEGHRYPPSGTVVADREGAWLQGRVSQPNLSRARSIWRLVDAESEFREDYVPLDWHLDFKSGYRWRQTVSYRRIGYGDALGADVKVPWELARMQHLPQLALTYAVAGADGDGELARRCLREFRNEVLDFAAANPPRFGVNWCCTMDVGIRVANWLAAYDLFRAAGAEFDQPFEREFMASVSAHGRHIIENLEWYPGLRSNHYLADIVGLLFVAAYLPADATTDTWLAFAVRELINEVGSQFLPDGANFEASTSYHRLSTEMVLYATALTLALPPEKTAAFSRYDHRRHHAPAPLPPAPLELHTVPGTDSRSPFPIWYLERIEKAGEFAVHYTKPSGRIVQIGDNDSGRFLKLQPLCTPLSVADARTRYLNLADYSDLPPDVTYWDEDPLDHRHLIAALDGLFQKADWQTVTGGGWIERELVRDIIGCRVVSSYRSDGEPPTAETIRVNEPPAGAWGSVPAVSAEGWQVLYQTTDFDLREGLKLCAFPDFGLYIFRSERLFLSIRCGPNGQNGNGGHAHNDQLAIELTVGGEDLLLDPGTYLYTPLPERRNEFRATAAHFTPAVPGVEQNGWKEGREGLFSIRDEAHAVCCRFAEFEFAGVHCGFGEEPQWRRVRVERDRILVADIGPGSTGTPWGFYSAGYGRLSVRPEPCSGAAAPSNP